VSRMDAPALAGGAPLAHNETLAGRLGGRPALVLLDVDGTLAPLAPRPEDARVPDETLAVVAGLVAAPATHVALVSGRAADDALRMVPVPGLWSVGNHGFETISPDGTLRIDARVVPYLDALRAAVAALEEVAAGVPGARVEDKRLTMSFHYRLAAPEAIPGLHEAVVNAGRLHGLAFTEGKTVLELRPPVDVHKGTASVALAGRLGALATDASLFFAGDDVTDEDAARSLREASPHAVTVRVGAVPNTGTEAEFAVPSLPALRELLEWMLELRRGGPQA
jgi:trehalose 6-phosphate phosphatase